jgi:cyclohexa-1,5-dienecarbonyl-CoA hydratase
MSEASTTETGKIHVRRDGRVAWMTIDRPPLNVMDIPLMHEMGRQMRELSLEVDVIVFRGAGERAFSAGVEVHDHVPSKVEEMISAFHGILRQIWRTDCISISAVDGYCLGGGAELATFCDFCVATDEAMFGQPEIRLGVFPPVALVTYPALVGPRAALDLILTGRTISAAEAMRIGLVNKVVPREELESAVGEFITELSGLSLSVLRMTRRELRRGVQGDFETMLKDAEALYLKELMRTDDAQEGIRAFIEKRKPTWHNR